MNSERQFRLFSIACLGLAALVAVSENSRSAVASAAEVPAVEVTQEELLESESVPVSDLQGSSGSPEWLTDVESVVEINQINVGRFRPYELGSFEAYR